MSDPLAVAISVAQVLEACGLRYLVGGSLASSMNGEPRSTLDVDIVVAMEASDVIPLSARLRGEFDVDDAAVARAVRERARVNVFHRASAIKVDLFVMGGSPLDDEPMARRQLVQVTADSGATTANAARAAGTPQPGRGTRARLPLMTSCDYDES